MLNETFSAVVMGTQNMIQETQTTIALGINPCKTCKDIIITTNFHSTGVE